MHLRGHTRLPAQVAKASFRLELQGPREPVCATYLHNQIHMEGPQGDAVDILGWYNFAYEGGEFMVCFRPGGKFFCNEYQAPGTWASQADMVLIDWKSYGECVLRGTPPSPLCMLRRPPRLRPASPAAPHRYEMKVDPATKAMQGCAKGTPADWRKATFVKPLSPVEVLLFGQGGGTEWSLEYEGGKFPVQFKADGYNHFNCPSYPAHSHYALDSHGTGNTIEVNWDKYGE